MGKYDQAVRDYKKGKSILHSNFPTSASVSLTESISMPGTPKNAHISPLESGSVSNGLQKVFEKVWSEVERVIVGLRSRLFKELSDMTLGMDVQERNMM